MSTKEEENGFSDSDKNEQDSSQEEINFKIILIGDSGVGKSSITIKAIKNQFDEYITSTVGFEFVSYSSKVDNKNINLQIWDTCGQEAYKSLIKSFYRNSVLAIIVYAIDNKESFKNLELWINDLKKESNPDVKIIIIGNKADNENERQISKQDGEQFCKDHSGSLFMETSAKTGININQLFDDAAKLLYEESKKLKERANNLNNKDLSFENDCGEKSVKRRKCIC